MANVDLSSGFQLEQPQVLVPWSISESQLQALFMGRDLRRVTDGYFVTRCTSLFGLSHSLGFHFSPRLRGRLVEFELFGAEYPYPDASYREFQRHLEAAFGPSTSTSVGTEGFPSHTWLLVGARVLHFVEEHFGPAERVRIERVELGS